ncbi:tRNA dimethylallyltransferase [Desulfohalotomaculum tongense]|uniref:tRNA (adenosine(37)-N6)-dimethylallyltransferase MiaA n=1 Tax=Desulforadius tongensis TaxID=1216062 RepID=UPI00195D8EE3|nr:tRNA (adenosine(37)-N6)-dimethylallyltransferase MiaA [Desulforadius tongensis]MBM7854141.1 tRNA dimethylallyltransferase [Desulforadius tongensis]
MKKPLLAIVGPTAIGKTEVGVQLALRLNGEVVSADSMLVYKGMDIGTAKPTIEERRGVPHHMIDVVMPWEEYNVALYQREAERIIAGIHNRGKLPLLVGGTGLYVRAVLDEYHFDSPKEDQKLRQELQNAAREKGNLWLHRQLAAVDPAAAENIHPNNVRRVIRALEVYKLTGKPFSGMQKAGYQSNSKYQIKIFGLTMPRELLYRRIEQRVEKMLEMGLVEEVKSLIQQGVKRSHTSMQGLGYKEIASYLAGEISLDRAAELIKRDTRRFAKRQFTWFKRDPRIYWIDMHNYDSISKVVSKIINAWQENFLVMSK